MDASEVDERMRRIMKILYAVPPDMHDEELVDIFAPLLRYLNREQLIRLRREIEGRILLPELLTLLDGNLALREILEDEE